MMIKVILSKAVTGLGGPGTVKSVADGYARNFLFPKGLAELATADKLQALATQEAVRQQKFEERGAEFQQAIAKLNTIKLTFKRKATSTGKLFAAIAVAEIAAELSQALAITIDPEMIMVESPIKSTGEHSVKVIFAPDLLGEFKIIVEPNG